MYDVLIIGAGPGGIFSAYELMERKPDLKIAVFEVGHPLEHRKCPIDGDKIKSCIHCKCCSIMSGFGGAGAFSDGICGWNQPPLWRGRHEAIFHCGNKIQENLHAARPASSGCFGPPSGYGY